MRPLTQQQIDVFRQAFEIFDTDHSGYIDKTELGSLLHAMGFDYTPTEIAQVFNSIDKDGSGMIEVDQFIDFMSKQIV